MAAAVSNAFTQRPGSMVFRWVTQMPPHRHKLTTLARQLGVGNQTPEGSGCAGGQTALRPNRVLKGADLVIWLMAELETAKARLETDKAFTRAYQSAIVDLLSISRGLRARITELELLEDVPAPKSEVALADA